MEITLNIIFEIIFFGGLDSRELFWVVFCAGYGFGIFGFLSLRADVGVVVFPFGFIVSNSLVLVCVE